MKKFSALFLGSLSALYATPSVTLTPVIEEFVPDYRLKVHATIKEATPSTVRTYFKSSDSANYMFVPMSCVGVECESVLPAVSNQTEAIDYLVLFVENKKVYKTQTFRALAITKEKIPEYQMAKSEEKIAVKTEMREKPKTIRGFSDSYMLDTVESSARFGAVAGLYGSSGATGTVAVSSQTIVATSGVTTSTLLIGGGALLAVGALVAVAGGGGGSSDGDLTLSLEGSWMVEAEVSNSETSTLYYSYLKEYSCMDGVVRAQSIGNYQATQCSERSCEDVSSDETLYQELIQNEEGRACSYAYGSYTTDFGAMSVSQNQITHTSGDGMHKIVQNKLD